MLDVLFITIDSLRADHIGSLGYERDTTPYLDRFAETAVLYENATAHGPTTFTAFSSIFTGKHAFTNDNFPALSGTTVAKQFNEAGYHTRSVTANAWTSPTYDYDRGFEDTHALGRGPRMANGFWDRARHRVGDAIGDGLAFDAIKSIYDTIHSTASGNQTQEDTIHDVVIDHINKDDPTFTWAHYMTTHTPYKPDPSAGSYFGTNLPEEESIKKLTGQARSESETLSTTNRTLLMDLYDESIRHVDRRINALLEAIDCSKTLVAITADHGEELWDHGGFEHPPKLYQELLAVPLLIHVPGGADGTVAKTVGLEAVGPTLLDRAGVETNRSVLPPWGNANDPVVSACAHSSQFEPMAVDPMDLRVAVRDGIQKYLRDPDGTEWLYNLATDPKEQSDRSTVAPDTTQTLATIADKQIEKFSFNDGEIPAELKDRLINLGYLE